MVLGPPRKGIKVTYCTDTRPTESILKHAADSDLFICEGMYGEKEKAAKAVEYKIVGSTEAKSLKNKISNESPIGKALIGKTEGAEIEVETPSGMMKFKVLKVTRD